MTRVRVAPPSVPEENVARLHFFDQRLIVTYSVKYQEYQKSIRNNQINRAVKIIESNPEN